jgi:hypothetical protein
MRADGGHLVPAKSDEAGSPPLQQTRTTENEKIRPAYSLVLPSYTPRFAL